MLRASFRAFVCSLLAGVTSLAQPSGSHADSTNQPVTNLKQLSLEELMVVTVGTVTAASRREETTLEAPGTVIVVDRRQIERRGYMTLVDVLRDLPGIDLIPYYFSEIGTQVAVRGINGNNKIIILVNGMRINPPGGEYYPLRSDLSVRHAERIEVIYGPGSTLHGQDAIAAVINIITVKPGTPQSEVSVAGGPDDTQQGWGTFSGTFGDASQFKVLGHVYAFHSDLTDLDSRYSEWWRPYQEVAQNKGSGTAADRVDNGLNAVVRLENTDSSLQVLHRVSERSSSEGFSTILGYVPEARWKDLSTVAEAQNLLRLWENVRLQSTLTYSRYEVDPETRYVFPSDDTRWYFDDYKYGLGTGASIDENLWLDFTPNLRLLVGGMASTYQVTPKSTVPGGADTSRDIGAQAGRFVYYTEPGNPATRHEIERVSTLSYETYAAYVESAWQMLPRWKTILGVRATEDTRFSDSPFTPRFALIHNLTDAITAKYTYTRAYVAPAPYFGNAPYDNGVVLNTSNPDLEPEKAESHEINLSYNQDGVNLGFSAYTTRQDNRLLIADSVLPQTVLINPVYLEDGRTRILGHTVNGGESENRGFDVYTECQWRRVSPWASYSFVDGEDHTPGQPSGLPGISKHHVRLGSTWAATTRLVLTPSFIIRSKPEQIDASEQSEDLPLPWEVNLHAQYRLCDSADLFMNIYNLTDHRYELGGITGNAVPQETIHGLAGIKVTF